MSGIDEAGAGGTEASREFLTFVLGRDEYGIEPQWVREIRGYGPVTAIANAPDYIKGKANLGGVIAPIVDLRVWFNVRQAQSAQYGPLTPVIVLSMNRQLTGLVVDRVSDVIAFPVRAGRASPLRSVPVPDYLIGLGTAGERSVVLLDIEILIATAAPHALL